MALDFRRDKKGPDEHGRYSYRDDKGDWFLVKYGPTYSNTLRVLEFSEEERAALERMERK